MCDNPTLTALRKLPDDRLRFIAGHSADLAGNDTDKLRAATAARVAELALQVCSERLENRLISEIASERRAALETVTALAGL